VLAVQTFYTPSVTVRRNYTVRGFTPTPVIEPIAPFVFDNAWVNVTGAAADSQVYYRVGAGGATVAYGGPFNLTCNGASVRCSINLFAWVRGLRICSNAGCSSDSCALGGDLWLPTVQFDIHKLYPLKLLAEHVIDVRKIFP
jgi:hypothetical protein